MRYLLALTALVLVACATTAPAENADTEATDTATEATEATEAPAETATDETAGTLARGAALAIDPTEAVTLQTVLADPTAFADKPIRVHGIATKVCQSKGCWLALGDAGTEATLTVKMKDHGFFVPTDSVGKKVAVEGIINGANLEHEHEEGHEHADGEECPDGTEMALIATGVELY